MDPLLTTVAVIAISGVAPRLESEAFSLFSAPQVAIVATAPTDATIVSPGESLQTWAQGYVSALVEGAHATRIERLFTEVLDYAALPDGWDGEDSKAPTEKDLVALVEVIESLPAGLPLPKPMVSSSGEVGLYWRTEQFVADILVTDGVPSLFIRAKDGSGRELLVPVEGSVERSLAEAFAQF